MYVWLQKNVDTPAKHTGKTRETIPNIQTFLVNFPSNFLCKSEHTFPEEQVPLLYIGQRLRQNSSLIQKITEMG